MIKLTNIERFYKNAAQKTWVLKDVSLDIEQGEFVTIMGPSGAGKSTLLNIIGMLDQPDNGAYQFFDEEVHKLRERKRHELHKHYMGFVFQAYYLIDELTVYENIETPLLYRKVPKAERQSRIADVLDRFNMVAKKDLFPHQLSGGQQQLVGVARAIIGKPKLLLADEPTGNLHSSQGEVIMDLFKQLHADGITIIQVTHNEKYAEYGTRVVELQDGFVREDRKVEQISAS
jgi:ABC-type lipoprotein export system ATPase subunit